MRQAGPDRIEALRDSSGFGLIARLLAPAVRHEAEDATVAEVQHGVKSQKGHIDEAVQCVNTASALTTANWAVLRSGTLDLRLRPKSGALADIFGGHRSQADILKTKNYSG